MKTIYFGLSSIIPEFQKHPLQNFKKYRKHFSVAHFPIIHIYHNFMKKIGFAIQNGDLFNFHDK